MATPFVTSFSFITSINENDIVIFKYIVFYYIVPYSCVAIYILKAKRLKTNHVFFAVSLLSSLIVTTQNFIKSHFNVRLC